jgi:O-acetyl-ADP-ribose deacetylase (regulator of RNase III)
MKIVLVRGDITRQEGVAIVNAANTGLRGGGGVDGAIHRAAGSAMLHEACRKIREEQGGCPTGEAVVTDGFNLPATYIIHTAGPVWHGGEKGEPELLANCYRHCLELAESCGVRTLAFPSISTGVYGYPIEQAVKIAFNTVLEHTATVVEEVRFVLFSDHDLSIYRQEMDSTDFQAQ